MQMSPEDMVRRALEKARRTQMRIRELNDIRTCSDPPLNAANREVMAQYGYLTSHAGGLSDEEFAIRVRQLSQLNYESLTTVTVSIDDLLDEIGLVHKDVRQEATTLLLGGPEVRANLAASVRRYKALFDTGGRKEKMDAWRARLRLKYPNHQKVVYKEGRSPYADGNMQSLYTL